jgi:hypothetical protein
MVNGRLPPQAGRGQERAALSVPSAGLSRRRAGLVQLLQIESNPDCSNFPKTRD